MIILSQDKRKALMSMVYLWASFSKDPRTKIGAVLARGDLPISVGFNGFPRKVQDLEERYNNQEVKYSLTVHSEENAVINCAREGISTLGSTLYTCAHPCAGCAKILINAGVSNIVLHKQFPLMNYSPKWVESVELAGIMFQETGVSVEYLDAELGFVGRLNGEDIYV